MYRSHWKSGIYFYSGSHLLFESSFLTSEIGRVILFTFWEISQVSFRFYIQSSIVSFPGGWKFFFLLLLMSHCKYNEDKTLPCNFPSVSQVPEATTSPCTPSSVQLLVGLQSHLIIPASCADISCAPVLFHFSWLQKVCHSQGTLYEFLSCSPSWWRMNFKYHI